MIEYKYDASGMKSQVRHIKTGGPAVTTDYVGNRIYVDGRLDKILTEEGYIAREGDSYRHYYFLKNHLGSNRVVLNSSGGIVQATNYYPTGFPFAELPRRSDQHVQPFKFNGKELDRMFWIDSYDYGARTYSPAIGRFMQPDPLAEKYFSVSPYAYCLNNPVKYVDPTGKDVWVKRLDDGTYEVVGGTANDDLNIYTVDAKGNRTDNTIGQTLTAYSFHSEDGVAINGAIINPMDNSGADFLNNEIIGANLGLTEYMSNATGGQPLDFKRRGIEGVSEGQQVQYMYRGMPLNEATDIVGNDGNGTIVYGSARDVGNVAAGYVAGRNGLTWQEARTGFDALETLQHMPTLKIWREGQPTQRAERVGWGNGNAAYWMNKTRRK